ncbi:MAG: hypothetical protein ACFFA2_12415 [Promethearchaeota archaeon]
MNDFFTIYIYTPWDSLHSEDLTSVKLLSLKSIFEKYPVIEPSFFDDLTLNISKHQHYSWYKSIRRIFGPDKEDYEIKSWNFIWAMDRERRIFQFLFQRIESGKDSKRILVALAPPELGKLFVHYKGDAILRTLSLLNKPQEVKFLIVLTPKGKSIAEEQQLVRFNKQDLNESQLVKILKKLPNVEGQWFPNFTPRCPICNELMMGLNGYKVGFGKLICPRCGYKRE